MDAETTVTGEKQYYKMRVATSEWSRTEPKTRWITVMADKTNFERIGKYLTKGKFVCVRGKETVQAYASKTGQLGVDTTVWAEGLEFVPVGEKQGSGEQAATGKDEMNSQMTTGSLSGAAPQPQAQAPAQQSMFAPSNDDEELPF